MAFKNIVTEATITWDFTPDATIADCGTGTMAVVYDGDCTLTIDLLVEEIEALTGELRLHPAMEAALRLEPSLRGKLEIMAQLTSDMTLLAKIEGCLDVLAQLEGDVALDED